MKFASRAQAHRSRWLGLLALVVLLGACGEAHVVNQAPPGRTQFRAVQQPPPHRAGAGDVEVVRGDTLYAIAFRNGMDFRDLAAVNGIEPPYTIYVGQVLKLHGERSRAAASPRPIVQAPPHPPASTNAVSTPSRHVPSPSTAAAPSPGATAPAPTPFEDVSSTAAATETTAPSPVVATPHPPPAGVAANAMPPTHPSVAPAQQPSVATQAGPTRPPQTGAAAPPPVVAAAPSPAPRTEDVTRTPSAAILPADVATVGGIHWRWPARGELLDRFMAGDATKQGIDVAGRAGDPVVAASDGVVVYSGSGLVGYGELVIIKHSDEWLSAYGHNRKRLVQEGQRVKAGQAIAEMGSTGAPRDELHFEIRRNGRPVDPMQYLPAH